MPPLYYESFAILGLLFICQFRFRDLLGRFGLRIYYVTLALIAATLLYQMHDAFTTLINAAPPDRYYAPPYTSISFFLLSSWTRIVGPYAVSIFISALALWGMRSPSRYQDRFEQGEPYLIAIAIALLPQPYWMIYAITMILLYLAASLWIARQKGAGTRLSFYHAWLPAAIIMLSAIPLLSRFDLLIAASFGVTTPQ